MQRASLLMKTAEVVESVAEQGAQAPPKGGSVRAMVQLRRKRGVCAEEVVKNGQEREGLKTEEEKVRGAAEEGLEGTPSALPHLQAIQAAFGEGHDLSGVRAYVGGESAAATRKMGAEAYAVGDAVVFGQAPDLHTAAHEAAHVVQQRGGVQLPGGVGRADDAYEREADAVAEAVVKGESAAPLLSRYARGQAPSKPQVQRRSVIGGHADRPQLHADYATLVQEQERALEGLRGQQGGQRTGVYGTIFEDARAFAQALEAELGRRRAEAINLADGVSMTLQQYGVMMGLDVPATVRSNLSDPSRAESRARDHMAAGGDVFGAFEGRWNGQWHNREASGAARNVGTFDHDWQRSAATREGGSILAQPVVMGAHDPSAPRPAAGAGAQTSGPTAAINAVDRESGIITGAVGVRGGEAERPHAGYFVNAQTLIWVARESADGPEVLYSCFFEHRRPSGAGASSVTTGSVPAGSYVIMGLQFRWRRPSAWRDGGAGPSAGALRFERLMGGLYTNPLSSSRGMTP